MRTDPACPSDEELIPLLVGDSADAVVASHVQDCPTCRQRFDTFRSGLSALRLVSLSMPPVAPPPPRPTRIGKYPVLGLIGSGGQADVYRAVHPTLDKELAIKLNRHAIGRLSEHRRYLIAEGKTLATLDHPNLVRVYDLDFHDDMPFLAMEFVRGMNLRQYTREYPVSPQTAARWVAAVARALAVAHRHGIVHQDVKPQNILIDEAGQPRLIDFGMARLKHAWDDSGQPVGGTLAFMAPEQARDEAAAIGPRSDVFALGAVLYFLLTGKAPFGGEDTLETLGRAGRGEFDRTALDAPGIPRRLRNTCLRAMATDPAARHPGATALADELDGHLARPRSLARLAGLGLAGLLSAGLGAGLWSLCFGPHATHAERTENAVALELVIARDGQSWDLEKALPLRPATDSWKLVAHVPHGRHAVVLKLNARGQVTTLACRPTPEAGGTALVFPATDDRRGFEPNAPGTEVVLVVTAETADALEGLEELTQCILAGSGPLPAMPVAAKPVWMNPSDPPHQTRSFGEPRADAVAAVESRLDELRQRLLNRDKKLAGFAAVAYGRG